MDKSKSVFILDKSKSKDVLNFAKKLKKGQPFRTVINHEMAGEIIALGGGKNRQKSQPHVARLVTAMKEGEWIFNGATISFYESGHLADGNHRLSAASQAEFDIDTIVVPGIPEQASATIDSSNKARPVSDNLRMQDIENAKEKAFIANCVVKFTDTGKFSGANPTNVRATKFVKRYDEQLDSCLEMAQNIFDNGNPKIMSFNKIATWLMWSKLFAVNDFEAAKELVEEIATGSSDDPNSVGLVVHKEIGRMQSTKTKNKPSINNLYGIMVKALKLKREGKTATFSAVKYPKRKNEHFPNL